MVRTTDGIREIIVDSHLADERIETTANPKDGTPGIQISSSDEYDNDEPHTIIYFNDLDALDKFIEVAEELRRKY